MKKLLFLILMFAFINPIDAEECTENKLKELKELADNINITTEFYDKNTAYEEYTTNFITIQGLTEDFYIYSDNKRYLFVYEDNVNGKIEDSITSDIKKLYIYNKSCSNKIIKEVKLSLKRYNPYSEYKECQELKTANLDICDPYYDKVLTSEEFYNKIEEYNKENKISKTTNQENNNSIYLIVGGAIALIIVIFLVIRRKRNILD